MFDGSWCWISEIVESGSDVMGHIYATIKISSKKRSVTLRKVLVDTRAWFTFVTPKVISKIQPKYIGTVEVELADGRIVNARVYSAKISLGDRSFNFAQIATFKGATRVIGAQTLEGLGVWTDSRKSKLVATRKKGVMYYHSIARKTYDRHLDTVLKKLQRRSDFRETFSGIMEVYKTAKEHEIYETSVHLAIDMMLLASYQIMREFLEHKGLKAPRWDGRRFSHKGKLLDILKKHSRKAGFAEVRKAYYDFTKKFMWFECIDHEEVEECLAFAENLIDEVAKSMPLRWKKPDIRKAVGGSVWYKEAKEHLKGSRSGTLS